MTTDAEFVSQESSCVVVGNLNPAILHPDWLAEHAGIDLESAQLGLLQTPPIFKPVFKLGELEMLCDSERLVVKSTGETGCPSELVVSILEVLNHTPVRAVGNNFRFRVRSEEVRKSLCNQLKTSLEDRLAERFPLESGQTKLTIMKENASVNVMFELSQEALGSVAFNFHRAVQNADEAVDAAREWGSDRQFSDTVLARIREIAR